jgi:cell filamentation protein
MPNEMNAVHPFVEGNGRTLREFLKDLADVAGHRLVVARLRKSTWYPASAHGFASGDSTMLRDCLLRALKPLPRT